MKTISEIEAAERAEFIQSVKALLIPSSLFLACVIMAGGVFLLSVHEPLGWAFVLVSVSTIIASMIGFVRFQNKYRAKGILPKHLQEDELVEPAAETQSDTRDEETVSAASSNNEPLLSDRAEQSAEAAVQHFGPDENDLPRIAATPRTKA